MTNSELKTKFCEHPRSTAHDGKVTCDFCGYVYPPLPPTLREVVKNKEIDRLEKENKAFREDIEDVVDFLSTDYFDEGSETSKLVERLELSLKRGMKKDNHG